MMHKADDPASAVSISKLLNASHDKSELPQVVCAYVYYSSTSSGISIVARVTHTVTS